MIKKIQIKPFIMKYFDTTLPADILRYMLKFCNKYMYVAEYTYRYKQNRRDKYCKQYIYETGYKTQFKGR